MTHRERFMRWITGGRPMRRICFCFTDVVSGHPVYLWQDAYGRRWYAESAWALFRVMPSVDSSVWTRR